MRPVLRLAPRPAALAALAAGAALGLVACGGQGDGGASHSFGTFTDCGTVGRLVRTGDPAGDQRGRLAGAKPQPQGDLVGVALARGGGRLCVEFRAAADIVPAAAYVLALRPARADTPVVRLEATVLAGEPPAALLADGRSGTFRKVDAKVGIRGDRLSIVVGRDVFAAHGIGGVFDAFRYQARTAVVVEDGGRLTDCTPVCS